MVIPTVAGVAPLVHGSGGTAPTLHVLGRRADARAAPVPHAGQLTITRTARVDDLALVNDMLERCTTDSRSARYQSGTPALRERQWLHVIHPDTGCSWVTQPFHDESTVIALTQLTRYSDAPQDLDFGILVQDDWQRHGLGTALIFRALSWARAQGFRRVRSITGASNQPMRKIARRVGATEAPGDTAATVDLALDLT
ncbi:GNAT family N-acetyltransferase [Streptomyces nanshensis]|uniref:GNAT family N-acetyltransferase n=1 Tax=Streptomyces nanshensis TaxID=518642 RepID=UPI00085BDA23|nr:GNAT family N-acetyltransferase [Streptomyces nanshensis]